MPRPICVPCAAEMKPARNGFLVAVLANNRYHETMSGDKYKCPTCNHEIVAGFGLPFYRPDTQAVADLTINV